MKSVLSDLKGFNLLTKHLEETFMVLHPMRWCLGRNLRKGQRSSLIHTFEKSQWGNGFATNEKKWPTPTTCLLDGETMLLLGEGVENLMWEIKWVAEDSMGWAGLEWAGAFRTASSFSSSSSMASPLSPSCWLTSFRRSTMSSMETGSWDINVMNGYSAEDFLGFTKLFFNVQQVLLDILEGLSWFKMTRHDTCLLNFICIGIIDLWQIHLELSQKGDASVLGLFHPIASLLRKPLVDLPGKHSITKHKL